MTISWTAQWAAFESKIFESEDSTLKKYKVKWLCNDSVVMQRICNNKFNFDRFGKPVALHSAVWFERSTEKIIKGETCYTQLYIIIHVYTFCCSSYTCITSFLSELYMYNFILLFELYMYNFISVWVVQYNSNPVLVIHSYTFLYILIHLFFLYRL